MIHPSAVRTRLALSALSIFLGLSVTACGSGQGTVSPSTTTSPAVIPNPLATPPVSTAARHLCGRLGKGWLQTGASLEGVPAFGPGRLGCRWTSSGGRYSAFIEYLAQAASLRTTHQTSKEYFDDARSLFGPVTTVAPRGLGAAAFLTTTHILYVLLPTGVLQVAVGEPRTEQSLTYGAARIVEKRLAAIVPKS